MSKRDQGRVDGVVVVGGDHHDFDHVRLDLLQRLAAQPHVRVAVCSDYDTALQHLDRSRFLVAYTSNVLPSATGQRQIARWVEGGARFLALHGVNAQLAMPAGPDLPYAAGTGDPDWYDLLGSQFLAHPPYQEHRVTTGGRTDPLTAGVDDFVVTDELYLMRVLSGNEVLLEADWRGTTPRFAAADWTQGEPHPVLYRRRRGAGAVLYLTLGHRRGRWDLAQPPFDGTPTDAVQPGPWGEGSFDTVLDRCLRWATDENHHELGADA